MMDNLYCKIMTSSAKPDGVDEFEHGYLNQSFGYLPSAIKAGESGNHKMGTFFFPDDEMDKHGNQTAPIVNVSLVRLNCYTK